MRNLVLAAVALVALVVPSSAVAKVPTCAHPSYNRGEVLPLELERFISENEWYVVGKNDPVGCYYILLESVDGAAPVWHLHVTPAINPDVAVGETICYRLAQTDDKDLPPGVWRWSNVVCVEGFAGEREGGF